jgi:hypothetical protein
MALAAALACCQRVWVHLQQVAQQQQQQGCLLLLVGPESAAVGVACYVLPRAAWSSVHWQLHQYHHLVLMQQQQQQQQQTRVWQAAAAVAAV